MLFSRYMCCHLHFLDLIRNRAELILYAHRYIRYAFGLRLGKQISVTNAGAFESSFFRLEKSGSNRDAEGFSGSLFLMGGECSGTVRNGFPFRVRDAAVCLHGKVIPLGTLEPGEEVEIGGFMLYHNPLNDNDTVASFLTGVFDGSAGLREHIESLERANFLSFYLSDAISGYTADARIIGFAEDTGEDLVSNKMMHTGMTLVTSTLPVEMRDGTVVCRSMLSRTPEVISGDYIMETNSCYRGDPVVLGYLPGFDIHILRNRISSSTAGMKAAAPTASGEPFPFIITVPAVLTSWNRTREVSAKRIFRDIFLPTTC